MVMYQELRKQSDDFLMVEKALGFVAFSNYFLVTKFVMEPFEK